jgi:hypothetical protein
MECVLIKSWCAARKQEVLSGYILSSVVLMDSRTLDGEGTAQMQSQECGNEGVREKKQVKMK